jgi:hypothetical protein
MNNQQFMIDIITLIYKKLVMINKRRLIEINSFNMHYEYFIMEPLIPGRRPLASGKMKMRK